MPRPKYRKHSSSDRAMVQMNGKRTLLPGRYGSQESIDAYAKIAAEYDLRVLAKQQVIAELKRKSKQRIRMSYRRHSSSDRAFVEYKGHRYYLPGKFQSQESLDAYQRFISMNARDLAKLGQVIYFLRGPDAVKIGITVDVNARIKTLQNATHQPLVLLGVIRGGERQEQQFHRKWKRLRLKGEWYRISPEMDAWITDTLKITAEDISNADRQILDEINSRMELESETS